MREKANLSQRELAEACGVNFGKIQRIEQHGKLKRQTIEIDLLEKWLARCGENLAEFVVRHAHLEALGKGLDRSSKTRRIVELFRAGMKDKAKRREIALAFHSVFGDELDGESLL